ncbi:vacuolar protein sorting-associated protein 33A [Neocloeon triangulifer]|uniref:vacuolar protein sorting-associated protein 33A n=1 Tax=Neocloeon triangulifer TaxID=2078957 RepID=UPI00286EDF42|nr:vacuolar protein sorting-associated protein 33A [Neocloeon triangulifer]
MNSNLSGGRLNIAALQDFARRELISMLEDGPKTLVWDEGLIGPVSLVAPYNLLKEQEFNQMFSLSEGSISSSTSRTVIFLTRPLPKLMDSIAEHVHNEERKGQRRDFHIIFVPRKTWLCETRLKNRGVYGNFKGNIHEWACDIYPVDSDVMSMEQPAAFKELIIEEDPTCIYSVAQGLSTLQELFGPIAKVSGQGKAAKQVLDLLRRIKAEKGAPEKSSGIDHLIVLDRGIDLLSPVATQLTYEGLIDELFGINQTKVIMPAEKFGQGEEQGKKTIILNSGEELFAELRDKNFSAVGNALSRKARIIAAEFDSRHGQTVQQMKQFVARLPQMTLAKQSLATHTTIAELIKEITDSFPFMDSLLVEQEFMNGIDTDKAHPFIEDQIAQKEDLLKVLRLICIQSITNSGLKPKVLDYYKREIVHVYGFEHLLTLTNLEKAGLLRSQQSARPFTVLRKTLRLVVQDGSESNPTDMSYVHSVYAPLTARLVQHLVYKPGGWKAIQDVLSSLPGPTILEEPLCEVQPLDSSKVIVVFFVGGCTMAEISALRFLAQQEEAPVELIVATTAIINGNNFLRNLMEVVK